MWLSANAMKLFNVLDKLRLLMFLILRMRKIDSISFDPKFNIIVIVFGD